MVIRAVPNVKTYFCGIKTVAVIRPPEPKAYVLVHFGHPRGVSAAGDLSGKQVILTAAIREKNLPSPSERLATDLANQLRKVGFQARVEDGPWEESDGRFKIDVEKITSSADAVLIVNPTLSDLSLPVLQAIMFRPLLRWLPSWATIGRSRYTEDTMRAAGILATAFGDLHRRQSRL